MAGLTRLEFFAEGIKAEHKWKEDDAWVLDWVTCERDRGGQWNCTPVINYGSDLSAPDPTPRKSGVRLYMSQMPEA